MKRILPLFSCALAAACGPREAGPSNIEFGDIQYWRVTGSSVSWGADCTDRAAFRSGVAAPTFEENSFLVYKIAADGKTATAQKCDTTLASSCVDSPTGIVFTVSGHTLSVDRPEHTEPLSGFNCSLASTEKWTLTDKGEALDMGVALSFDLKGDAFDCNLVEEQEKAAAPNGKGIKGCVLTLQIATTFDH